MYNLYNLKPSKGLWRFLRKLTRINTNERRADRLRPWMAYNVASPTRIDTNGIGYQIAEMLTAILIFALSAILLFTF